MNKTNPPPRGALGRMSRFAFLLLLPVAAGAVPVMPYGTYLVKGSFRGDYNTVLSDFGTATVRAQRADGTVISEATVGSADAAGYNFILQIPVAKESTAKSCKVGETLDCVFATSEGSLEVPEALTVDTPINVGIFAINCTEVETYTNQTDGAVIEIPVAYIAEAQAFLDEFGQGENYDPWGDYDNDGISNYAEFVAGTIPFDESDYLRIREFNPAEDKFALKFEHVGGHVYAVSSANTLAQPQWASRHVRKDADGAELDQVLADGPEGEPGLTEIFITPAAGATSEFFKLEAK